MAKKLNEKPTVAADRITSDLVKETVETIRDKRQDLTDAQMAHASEYKVAEKRGLHTKALKLVVGLAKEEPNKRRAFISHLKHYIGVLGLDQDPQRQLFQGSEDLPSKEDVVSAVGEVNMVDSGPDLSTIPNTPLPADFEGRKRLVGAWQKGIEARRENRPRADCFLTGAESIAVFERAWDAMDEAIRRATDGGAQTVTNAATGDDLPEGMSQEEFNALFQEGIALFRSGKAPGAHAHGDDPVKAGVVMKGWAAEQDAQNQARTAEREAEKGDGPAVVAEATLTPEEVAAIEAEGAAACEAGGTQSDCEYPAGSAKADAWLAGFERQDAAIFEEAAPAGEVAVVAESADQRDEDEDFGIPEPPEEDDADSDVSDLPVAAFAAAAPAMSPDVIFPAE